MKQIIYSFLFSFISVLSFGQAPSNDGCFSPLYLSVNPNFSCGSTTVGTTVGATGVSNSYNDYGADDDVWFAFTATKEKLLLTVTPGTMINVVFEVRGDCNLGLNPFYIVNSTDGSNPENKLLTGLILNQTYRVRVYSFGTSGGQGDFTICLGEIPPLTNDECTGSIDVPVNPSTPCSNIVSGVLLGATQSRPACSGSTTKDVWYKFTATSSSHYLKINGLNSFTPVFEVFSGNCGSLTSLGCHYQSTVYTQESYIQGLTIGTTYYIRIYNINNADNGYFSICINTPIPPANDDCLGAVNVPINAGILCDNTTSGNSLYATQSMPGCLTPGGLGAADSDDDVWFKFTATQTKHFIDVVGTPVGSSYFEPRIQVFSGSCSSLTSISCEFGGATAVSGLIVGNTYYFRVYSFGYERFQGPFLICIRTPVPGDICDNSINLDALTSPYSGTTADGATNDLGFACNASEGYNYSDKVFNLSVENENVLTIFSLSNYPSATRLGYEGLCPGNSVISCYTNDAITKWLNNTGAIQTLYLVQDASGYPYGGPFSLNWHKAPREINDECTGAITLAVSQNGSCTYTAASAMGATKSVNIQPSCTTTGNDDDVWFKFTTSVNGLYKINYNILSTKFYSTPTLGTELYMGNCSSLTPVSGTCTNAFGSDGIGSTVVFLAANSTYYLRMWTTGNVPLATFSLCVEAPTSCPFPTDLSNSALTGVSATFNWTESGTATSWDISYAPTSLNDPSAGTIVHVTSNPSTIFGLLQDTNFDWYVRSYCGNTPSPWSLKGSFKTYFDCATSSILTCGTPVSSGNLSALGGLWFFSGFPPNNACNMGGTYGREKVYRFTPSYSGTYKLTIMSGNNSLSSNINYFYKVAGTCSNTGWTCISTQSSDFGPLIAGTEYYILLDGFDNGTLGNEAIHTFKIECPLDQSLVHLDFDQSYISIPQQADAGSTSTRVARIEVYVINEGLPLYVTKFNLNTNGTTDVSNIINAKIFFTGTNKNFSTENQFGTTFLNPSDAFSITGNQAMTGGRFENTRNYFWLTYDIAPCTNSTIYYDIECPSMLISGVTQIPQVLTSSSVEVTPATISAFDTKANGDWNNPNTWTCGIIPFGSTFPINIKHNTTINQGYTMNNIVNVYSQAILTINGGTNTIDFFSDVTNDGRIIWNSGQLNLNGKITLTNNGVLVCNGTNSLLIGGSKSNLINCGEIKSAANTFLDVNKASCVMTGSEPKITGINTLNFRSTFSNDNIIAPGNSPGTLTINPSVSSTSTAVYDMEIIGGFGAAGTADDADQLASAGDIALNGTLHLILNNPAAGSYAIFNSTGGAISGFSSMNVLYSVNGGAYTSTPPSNVTIQVNSNTIVVNITGIVLPVELVAFQAQNTEGGNQLTWQTASEKNVQDFDVEKSIDGKAFDKIGTVKAKGKAANYEFLDKTVVSGLMYYRLKINDLDGKMDYSKTVSVRQKGKGLTAKAFPNPTQGTLTVEIEVAEKSDVTIELTDILGRQVWLSKAENTEGVTTFPIPMSELVNGNYFLKVSNGQAVVQQKVVKN